MKNNLPVVSTGFAFLNSVSNATLKLIAAAFLFLQIFQPLQLFAQQLQMSDFVVFSGNAGSSGCTSASAPGAGVQIGCNSSINGGAVGSLKLIQTTGPATISGNLNSKETVDLAANAVITGKITVANAANSNSAVLTVAAGATLGGNIDVKGNTTVVSGNIYGKVTHPSGTSYTGPTPAGGNVVGTPALPVFPALPAITNFAPYLSLPDINTTKSITPGKYDDIKLPGAKTLTFNGTGDYIFDKIENVGVNTFVFDFKNSATGSIRLLIHNDVNLDRINVSIINGGSASRIYTEVHGNGSSSSNGTYSFLIANGASGAANSSWAGTVWAPYAAIKIGSLSGGTDINGALWSGTQVNIRCGVTITAAGSSVPTCSTPNVNAGLDKQLTCTASTVQLSGSSSTSGVSYNWTATNGGNIVSGATTATPTVNATGTYTLTVTTLVGSCSASDVAQVTFNGIVPNANAGADKQITCSSSTVQLSGSSSTSGVSYAWVASNGGNIVSGANTATPTVNTAGTYTLTVTATSGCTKTDVAL